MKLFAISDLHVGCAANREGLARIASHEDDWLIVAGDVGEAEQHLEFAWDVLQRRFRKLIWVPGNHELWTTGKDPLRGVAKYERLVALCRGRGVLTPEDSYVSWAGEGGPHVIAPLFLLYDYSFRPDTVPFERALPWAAESGVLCADEALLFPDPYPSRQDWCAARCSMTERRLDAARAASDVPFVLVNHFPLKRSLAVLPAIPRFELWCGTRRTENWHVRYRASVVVSGHLHIRRTDRIDGVRFEEVSLGYPPKQWDTTGSAERYLRQILPALE
jgi:predicted phosphodiesterase